MTVFGSQCQVFLQCRMSYMPDLDGSLRSHVTVCFCFFFCFFAREEIKDISFTPEIPSKMLLTPTLERKGSSSPSIRGGREGKYASYNRKLSKL